MVFFYVQLDPSRNLKQMPALFVRPRQAHGAVEAADLDTLIHLSVCVHQTQKFEATESFYSSAFVLLTCVVASLHEGSS